MAHSDPIPARRPAIQSDWVRALLMLVAGLAAMAVLTAIFGVTHPGPAYDILPDPAGALPF